MAGRKQTDDPLDWEGKIDLGTPDGYAEYRVLYALTFDPSFVWITRTGIAARSGLSEQEVQRALDRLLQIGLVTRHPTFPSHFGETFCVRPWLVEGGPQGPQRAASPGTSASTCEPSAV